MSSPTRIRPVFIHNSVTELSSAQSSRTSGDEGFSILELDRAGLSESRARALGLPIDGTRHSALRHNVRHLKHYAG